ncbi:MAG: hypothetical protein KatS3mg059_0923 [Thermomicrobiales bacterium]|nr:MAG: hypothetical protein KatS3mg059_0923 [Thermomicrobiales bacterium]
MAYRFLLEVPEDLAAEANVAVSAAGDAQVVVVRNSHGLGFDDPYVDLTVAAHTLRVIDTLYDWFDDLGASRPDIRVVLHSGERLALAEHNRSTVVAAIRRDQPWVERSIPKLGEHDVEEIGAAPAVPPAKPVAAAPGEIAAPAGVTAPAVTAAGMEERRVAIRDVNHIALRVTDLEKAERFYQEFFGMELLGRARRAGNGYQVLNGSYSWDEATRTGQEADVTFLRNGPLTIALQRLGRGARLDRTLLDHISIRVDASTFTNLKGTILMRSYEVLASAETALLFRDPFGIAWEITLQSPQAF